MTELIEREQPTRLFRIPVADWDELPRDRRVTLEEFATSDEPIAGQVNLSIDESDLQELDRKDRQFLKTYDRTPGVEYITELLKRSGELLWFRVPTMMMEDALPERAQTDLFTFCAFEEGTRADDVTLTYAIPRPAFDKFESFVQQWLTHFAINAPQVTSHNTVDVTAASSQSSANASELVTFAETLTALAIEIQEMQMRMSTLEASMQQHRHTGSGGVTSVPRDIIEPMTAPNEK